MTETLRPESGYGSSFVTRRDIEAWFEDFAAPNEEAWVDYLFKLELIEFDQEKQAFVLADDCYDPSKQIELLQKLGTTD